MKRFYLLALIILVGCGGSQQHTHGDRPPTEGDGLRSASASAPALVNALSGVLQSLLKEEGTVVTRIGEAVPKDTDPIQLTAPSSGSKSFEKVFESILGADLIRLEYKIEYHYGAELNGKGRYIPNVTFVPVRLETDPLWSLNAVAVSEKPTNKGDAANPVSELGFAITFTAKGLGGTRSVTDEFVIDGKTGELKATIREFEK